MDIYLKLKPEAARGSGVKSMNTQGVIHVGVLCSRAFCQSENEAVILRPTH